MPQLTVDPVQFCRQSRGPLLLPTGDGPDHEYRNDPSHPTQEVAPKEQLRSLTELLERAQPDVVLNAIVGFAGLDTTLWTLEAGVALALANKESLVAAGDMAVAARSRGRAT